MLVADFQALALNANAEPVVQAPPSHRDAAFDLFSELHILCYTKPVTPGKRISYASKILKAYGDNNLFRRLKDCADERQLSDVMPNGDCGSMFHLKEEINTELPSLLGDLLDGPDCNKDLFLKRFEALIDRCCKKVLKIFKVKKRVINITVYIFTDGSVSSLFRNIHDLRHDRYYLREATLCSRDVERCYTFKIFDTPLTRSLYNRGGEDRSCANSEYEYLTYCCSCDEDSLRQIRRVLRGHDIEYLDPEHLEMLLTNDVDDIEGVAKLIRDGDL